MILSSFLTLALVSCALADPIHIPLRKRNPLLNANGTIDQNKVADAAQRMRDRYGWSTPGARKRMVKRQGQTVGVSVINQVGSSFASSSQGGTGGHKSLQITQTNVVDERGLPALLGAVVSFPQFLALTLSVETRLVLSRPSVRRYSRPNLQRRPRHRFVRLVGRRVRLCRLHQRDPHL